MSDRLANERLGTSMLSHVFLKIYPYDLRFMQSKIKICETNFSQTKKNVKFRLFYAS